MNSYHTQKLDDHML